MRCIVNVNETNFSLDGCEGGRGGHPANTITTGNAARSGTGQKKSSVSSSTVLYVLTGFTAENLPVAKRIICIPLRIKVPNKVRYRLIPFSQYSSSPFRKSSSEVDECRNWISDKMLPCTYLGNLFKWSLQFFTT
jgi:hypothetical protein